MLPADRRHPDVIEVPGLERLLGLRGYGANEAHAACGSASPPPETAADAALWASG
jgi:hypothetical protein